MLYEVITGDYADTHPWKVVEHKLIGSVFPIYDEDGTVFLDGSSPSISTGDFTVNFTENDNTQSYDLSIQTNYPSDYYIQLSAFDRNNFV